MKVGRNMSKFNEKKMVDDIRLLALDMINNAGSGHPGIALSAAPMLYSLFAKHMVFDLNNTIAPLTLNKPNKKIIDLFQELKDMKSMQKIQNFCIG